MAHGRFTLTLLLQRGPALASTNGEARPPGHHTRRCERGLRVHLVPLRPERAHRTSPNSAIQARHLMFSPATRSRRSIRSSPPHARLLLRIPLHRTRPGRREGRTGRARCGGFPPTKVSYATRPSSCAWVGPRSSFALQRVLADEGRWESAAEAPATS